MWFDILLVAAAAIAIGGAFIAYDGSRDVFHPLILIGPMLAFLYGWMPWKLDSSGGLERYLDQEQLIHVQLLFVCGILAFVAACLMPGVRVRRPDRNRIQYAEVASQQGRRLLAGAAITGFLGLLCWGISIVNVGGFVAAYSTSYSGGWDDSGYIRDGSLLLLSGLLLALTALLAGASRVWCWIFIVMFSAPWLSQALLMARRGPTFAYVVVVLMGWYFNRGKRPPILLMTALSVGLGWLVLFLVTNRTAIYLGSNFELVTDVRDIVEKPDPGNEYIYGSGTVIAVESSKHYYWLRRYLAQLLIRPIPSAIWPTKYEDFGMPELLHNAGTGEGFTDVLGWKAPPGAAPGIIADLFVELSWLAIPAMALLGYAHGWVWRKAATLGGAWTSQYILLSALSIYLVMQTMEAVIFRIMLLSIPCWLTWRWSEKASVEPDKAFGIAPCPSLHYQRRP